VSDKQPPSTGPGRRAARPGARKAKPAAAASGARGSGAAGSGKNGRIRARDLSGWPKARHIAKKTAKWGSVVGFSCLVLAAIAVYITYKMIDIPNPNTDFQAQTTTVYYSDGKHVLGTFALQNRDSIPLSEMPKSLQDAAMSAEDRSFETNKGLDPKGIVRAAWSNLHSDAGTQGASTITQQYVKILYLSQERTWKRKIKEAFLAVKVQNTLSKDQILEGYLNTIYFGRGAYGVQAASKAYFAKDAKDLSVPESAVLASVLNSPGALDPAEGKDAKAALLSRYRYVLDGMVSMGNLDAAKAEKFEEHLPKFPVIRQVSKYHGQKGYLLNLVQQQLQEEDFTDEEINGGGLKVVTTLDWHDELAAQRAVKVVRPRGRPELHMALASVEPGTGALRAMIGGRDYTGPGPQDQVNLATAASPAGSTFKPFALAAALKDGFTLRSTFNGSSPLELPDGSTVHNEGESSGVPDGISYGTVDLTRATEDSINTAYVDMTTKMPNGPEKIREAAVAAGIPSSAKLSPGLTANGRIALGIASIKPVEMAEGYATFATNGEHDDWYVIQKVSDPNGLRYEHKARPDRPFSPAIASNVTYALEQVVDNGTGQRAQALDRPAAGKTGTATATTANGDQRVVSSWFTGYTPQLSTAVTLTRGNGTKPLDGYLDTFFGADYPTETWTEYMKVALEGQPVRDFPEPAELHGENPTYSPPPTTFAPTTTSPSTTTPTTTKPTETTPTTTRPTTTRPTQTTPTQTTPTTCLLPPGQCPTTTTSSTTQPGQTTAAGPASPKAVRREDP
jgi:membrane peptidoglycan carboxypeptidase